MKLSCVWEHNGNDSILYAETFPGAFTRGASKEEAMEKMPEEIRRFLLWQNQPVPGDYEVEIVREKESGRSGRLPYRMCSGFPVKVRLKSRCRERQRIRFDGTLNPPITAEAEMYRCKRRPDYSGRLFFDFVKEALFRCKRAALFR